MGILEIEIFYYWAILIIIVLMGVFLIVVLSLSKGDYHTETKAYFNEKYSCDLYLEYEGNCIKNISLLDCLYWG